VRVPVLLACSILVLAHSAGAISVKDSRIAASVSEESCRVPKPVGVFQPTDRQVFLWFQARQVQAGDQLRVEWLDPSGVVSNSAEYGELPSTTEVCFTSQLPVAGFPPASQPGNWTVRVLSNGRPLFSRTFQIAAEKENGGPAVTSVTWSGVRAQEIDFTVQGKNFQANPLVLIAQYTASGGWTYLASLQPREVSPNLLRVHYAGLPANEYLVIVENPDQRMSQPMPFVIATEGYKLPTTAGEPWVITQGPHGTFSHWGNALHAYDIAPQSGRCIVAMKGGIAYTHDLGLAQDHHHRSFGNYITIDHGNGEFSHYAHLAAGSFVVQNGQRVEQGQALATVGNSGYTLGEGGGYHVHVSVTRALAISAPSVPFQFEDLPEGGRATNRTVVSSNASALCNCGERRASGGAVALQFSGQVSVAEWWSDVVVVARGSKMFDVSLSWPDAKNSLDLHLVSPSGHHYAWYADTTGYSGSKTNPQEFHLPKPEAGPWRISVQGVQGSGPIDFGLGTTGKKMNQQLVAVSAGQ